MGTDLQPYQDPCVNPLDPPSPHPASPNSRPVDSHCMCWNPDCSDRQNSAKRLVCHACGSPLRLADRYQAVRSLGQGKQNRTWLAIDLGADSANEPTLPHPQNFQTPHAQNLCVVKQFWHQSPSLTDALVQKVQHYNQVAACCDRLPKVRDCLVQSRKIDPAWNHHSSDDHGCNALSDNYLIQDYIVGDQLETLLTTVGTLTIEQAWQILIDILPILQAFQSVNFIHGDIKPENIVRRSLSVGQSGADESQSGKTHAFTLVELGLLLVSGSESGNPAYAAPEQIKGNPTFASDLYSLGMTCIHLLTGIHPFQLRLTDGNNHWQHYWLREDENTSENFSSNNIYHAAENDWERQQLSNILDRMIADDLDHRFDNAEEVVKAIAQLGKPIIPLQLPPATGWICTATWQALAGQSNPLQAIALSPQAAYLAMASEDPILRLWNLPIPSVPFSRPLLLSGHERAVTCLDFHPHNPLQLISGSRDRTLKQWQIQADEQGNLQAAHIRHSWLGHSQGVTAVRWSPDGQWIASGGKDGYLKLWWAETGNLWTQVKGYRLGITAIAWNPSFWALLVGDRSRNFLSWLPLLASASADSTIQLWQIGEQCFLDHNSLRQNLHDQNSQNQNSQNQKLHDQNLQNQKLHNQNLHDQKLRDNWHENAVMFTSCDRQLLQIDTSTPPVL
ncbi:MAG: 4-Cys prefix domain-containing protein, partial [Synechococcales bacterium]|nr:4-Cys prefix domain-containing protein [Synechococcales bacterium]